MAIQLLANFGLPARGVSPYADALHAALLTHAETKIEQLDYASAYPSALHPARASGGVPHGVLHWARPQSWVRIGRSKASVLHIQHWFPQASYYLAVVALLSRLGGKRLVVTVHNPQHHETAKIFGCLERFWLRLADVLIVHNERGAEALSRRVGGRHKIRVVPHGVSIVEPPTVVPDDYAALGVPEGRRYILMFGNMRAYKGVARLLRVWGRVSRELEGVDLLVAGRSWVSQGLDKVAEVERQGCGHGEGGRSESHAVRTRWIDEFLSEDKIDRLLRIADFAVFPYEEFSSQSGAACRAAGSGCPVLVSDVGGLPELAIGPEWIFNPGDDDALASALHEHLSRPRDTSALREQQIARVRNFCWTKVAQMHIDIYEDVMR